MSPDITMCDDKECPNRDKCYRFTAKPNHLHQSYFVESPKKGDKCEYFLGVEKKQTKTRG